VVGTGTLDYKHLPHSVKLVNITGMVVKASGDSTGSRCWSNICI